ncbi:MAG: type IV pilus twitching motility protein PilT [Myxococcota bacterium]
MARLDSFLRVVVEQGASDLHISAGAVPAIRRDGELIPLPFRPLEEREMRRFLQEGLSPEEHDQFAESKEIDFVYQIEGSARFRGNAFEHVGGVGAVFRIIPERVQTLEELRLPSSVHALSALPHGLVLVCGATGAGKTSTVAALIDAINQREARHIITIEDPIELVHTSRVSVISQRQIGRHTKSFAAAVGAALREAPDVLLLGELRDADTVEIALGAADAGALVLGTLHASSASQAVHRVVDLFPDHRRAAALRLFGEQFRAIVAQQLVPARSGDGRLPVIELLLHTRQSAQLVKDGKVHQIERELIEDDGSTGATSMDRSLAAAVRAGNIHLRDALRFATDAEQVRGWLQRDGGTAPKGVQPARA